MQIVRDLKYMDKRILCVKCNSKQIIMAGKIHTKISGTKQKLRCKACKKYFSLRDINFGKKIPFSVRRKILKLNKMHKGYINITDSLKKTTYSSREIAKKLNVSSTFVCEVIKQDGES